MLRATAVPRDNVTSVSGSHSVRLDEGESPLNGVDQPTTPEKAPDAMGHQLPSRNR